MIIEEDICDFCEEKRQCAVFRAGGHFYSVSLCRECLTILLKEIATNEEEWNGDYIDPDQIEEEEEKEEDV